MADPVKGSVVFARNLPQMNAVQSFQGSAIVQQREATSPGFEDQ